MAVVFGEESEKISLFGNALREFLGLAPLYVDGRWSELESEAERPWIEPWPWVGGRVDGNGMRKRLGAEHG